MTVYVSSGVNASINPYTLQPYSVTPVSVTSMPAVSHPATTTSTTTSGGGGGGTSLPLAANYTTIASYQQALTNAGMNATAAATQASDAASMGLLGGSSQTTTTTPTSTTAQTGTTPLASNYSTQASYQQALVSAGWNVTAAQTQAQQAQSMGLLGTSTQTATTNPVVTNPAVTTPTTPVVTTPIVTTPAIVAPLPPTGSEILDRLQNEFNNVIQGSLTAGYTINPALSITPETVGQFIQQTASQLNPRLQQNLTNEITGINQAINQLATNFQNQQGQTVQDYQQSLGTLRDQTSMVGGGERALESGLTNSAQRSLSTQAVNASTAIGNQLREGGASVGQGFGGTTLPSSFGGGSIPGVTGNASSFNIPSLYGRTLSNQGGDSTFAGSANQSGALDYNYNPSTYQYGSLPGAYSTDFSNLLNTTTGNYIRGQIATGNTNQVLSSYGRTLAGFP